LCCEVSRLTLSIAIRSHLSGLESHSFFILDLDYSISSFGSIGSFTKISCVLGIPHSYCCFRWQISIDGDGRQIKSFHHLRSDTEAFTGQLRQPLETRVSWQTSVIVSRIRIVRVHWILHGGARILLPIEVVYVEVYPV
jgi:hypothetical protein